MKRTYQYRIYPTGEQKVLLAKHFGHCRWVYNYALSRKISHYQQTNSTLSRYDIQAELPILKRQEATEWLKEVNAQSLQAVLIHLENAYAKFFSKSGGFPKLKNRKSKQSFEIPANLNVDFSKSEIRLPKFKDPIKAVFHREFIGEIRTCHVKRTNAGSYFVTILVEDGKELPSKPPTVKDTAIGIDVGIKSFVTTSLGDKVKNPRHFIKCQRRLAATQRSFSRKLKLNKKGEPLSKNAEKQKLKLQMLHETVANQRKDFLHKVSIQLIRENQTICVEDLNVKGLMQNSNLSKHIGDAGWGMFFQFLRYKSDWYGSNLLSIGRFDPSSKTCSNCGHIKEDLKLRDREWSCSVCKKNHDRDVNAAINIRDFHFSHTGSNRNTQEFKSASYGTTVVASAERMSVMAFEAPESLAQG